MIWAVIITRLPLIVEPVRHTRNGKVRCSAYQARINGTGNLKMRPGMEPELGCADGTAGTAFICSFLGSHSSATLDGYATKKFTYRDPGGESSSLTEYECTQKQRSFERAIRESKAILAAYNAAMASAPNETLENMLKEEFANESVILKRTERELKDFCRQTHRSVDSARTQVYAVRDDSGHIVNFGKSVSQKAVWANKKSR